MNFAISFGNFTHNLEKFCSWDVDFFNSWAIMVQDLGIFNGRFRKIQKESSAAMEYDKTPQGLFRQLLNEIIDETMSICNVRNCEKEVILDYLQLQAKTNGVTTLSDIKWLDKMAWNSKRPKTAELVLDSHVIIERSVGLLVKTGAAKAASEKRDTLTLDDIKYAFGEHFCDVYPICKGTNIKS